MSEAEDKFGSKGKTNAALTLGIIGTGLAALSNNGGCGCGNNGGLLGGLFGGNNGNCSLAERAMQMAYAQGQMADNLAWSNRVQSMQDDIDLYTYINGQTKVLSEAGFLGYLGSKFAVEYVTTPDGKIAANNLLTTIKQQKERVNEGLRAKQQKIDKLLNLLENDPDLKKKYEEMLTNNQ